MFAHYYTTLNERRVFADLSPKFESLWLQVEIRRNTIVLIGDGDYFMYSSICHHCNVYISIRIHENSNNNRDTYDCEYFCGNIFSRI